MTLPGRAVIFAILVVLGDFQSAHSQPLLSSYAVDLDDRLTLAHSSRDAFRVLDGGNEVLMIDPVWDGIQLDAYCKLPKALFVRVHRVPEKGQPSDTTASFFVIDVPDANGAAICTGPLTHDEFQYKLLSMSVGSADVVWTIPADPNPNGKKLMRLFFLGFSLAVISGIILPIPFALVLWHYVLLKKKLRRLTGNGESLSGLT